MVSSVDRTNAAALETADIRRYINGNAPFGPVASEQISDRLLWEKLFDRENRTYAHLVKRDPALVIGRRGAGKTAFLFALTTDEPTLNVKVNTSTAVAEIEDLLRALADLRATLFAEHLSDIWASALWHGIFVSLVEEVPDVIDQQDPRFRAVRLYLKDLENGATELMSCEAALGLFCYQFAIQAEKKKLITRNPYLFKLGDSTLQDVIASAQHLLREAGLNPVLLMDSIEDFQDVLDYHTRAIEGLFMQVGKSGQPEAPFRIRFSFPAELWNVLRMMSRNPLKDFGRGIILQWSAREIVKIAAHRFKLYLETFHEPYLKSNREIAMLNMDSENDALELLRMVLPPKVKGEIGIEEDTIAYVLRHTQLLPRHLLRLLNSIWNRGSNGSDGVRVSEDAVIKGVRDIEDHIVTEICKAYELVHPLADGVCRAVIKNLPRRFSDSDLHKAFNRAGKGALKRGYRRLEERRYAGGDDRFGSVDPGSADMDYFDFKTMLVEIGCIGRQRDETERYYIAEFEYAIPHRLNIGDDDMMCVHPLFSGVYQSKRDAGIDRRLVYPYGSDPTVDHRQEMS